VTDRHAHATLLTRFDVGAGPIERREEAARRVIVDCEARALKENLLRLPKGDPTYELAERFALRG
jgi:hypothetical protein